MIHICTKYLGVETYEVMFSKAPFGFIFWNHVIIKPPKDAQPRDELPALASMRSPEPFDSAVHGSSTSDVVMQPNPPEPVLAAPAPPVTTPTPPRSNPEVPLGSVATGLERGHVTPKGTSKPVTRTSEQNLKDGEIRFAPVTAAGMSAFFAAIRRPSTQVSFTTEGSQDMEINAATPPVPEATQVVVVAPATTQETAPASATQDVPVAPATPPSVIAESGMTEEPPVAAPASESGMARETPLVAPAPPQVIPPEDGIPPAATPSPTEVRVIPPAATPSPTEVRDVSEGSPDTFVADLTALANDTPEVTPPAPSDGTTPNGLVAALNNLADRIPSVAEVADIADDGQTKKQSKAQYMRYYRSVRGPNCPDIIRRKFQEAQACSNQMESQAKTQALFEEFKHCNEDWLSSQIVLREIRSHTTSHQGIWKWMTRDES